MRRIGLAAMLLACAAAPPAMAATPAELERAALKAELNRTLDELRLPDEATPWYVAYDLIEGQHTTSFAEFGALLQDDLRPLRQLRIEVRTGTPEFDSADFEAFGEPDGVTMVSLPMEPNAVATQRAAWLATDRAYKQAIEQLSRKQAALAGLLDPPEHPSLTPTPAVVTERQEARPLDEQGIRQAVVQLSRALADYPELESGQAAGRDWQGTRLTVNSQGMELSRTTGFAVIRVEAVLKHPDGSRLRDGRWWVADTVEQLPSIEEMEAETRVMADWLMSLKDAPVLDNYLGPVLFEGPAAGELFRQLTAPELVGTTPPQEGPGEYGVLSERRPTGRIGRRLLPEGWTVTDSPGLSEATGAYTWDHEGVPGQTVELVEDGVVRRLLTSRVANGPDDRSTGHGRALGMDRRDAVPTIVSVQPRRSVSERRMHRKALRLASQTGRDSVLVIRRIEPPAMTEDFDVFFTGEGPPPGLTPPYEAYMLGSDGSVQPVRGAAFIGVDRRALRDIALAGEPGAWLGVLDASPGPSRFHIGPVGGLAGAWSVPPVLITELELVGNAGGESRVLPRP